jgi:hypothetical protein
MKKLKIFFPMLLAIASLTFFAGCQKEPASYAAPENGTPKYPSCSEASVTYETVLDLMVNADDAADQRLNHILYHYGRAVKKAVENTTKRCQLLDAMLAENGDGEISLLDFATENASFGADLNADLRQSISENTVYPKGVESGIEAQLEQTNWDANAYLRSKFTYEGTQYEPKAHFIKRPERCDLSKPIVVVIGTDVNDCDDVAGWRGNTEILLGEAEANSTSDIVIYIGVGESGNASPSSLVSRPGSSLNDLALQDRMLAIDFDVDEFMIKKRFDHSRKSEINGGWTYYSPTADGIEKYTEADDFDPKRVHKDDIGEDGELFTDDQDWMDELPNMSWSIHFFCWENDWYATTKHIENECITDGNSNNQDGEYDMSSKRKLSSDMYFNICSITAQNMFPQVNSTVTTNNDAAYFKIKRKS